MKPSRLHLFQAYGIELEYMIVNKDTLAVRPITDEVFKQVMGEYCSDVEKGPVTWSNELVLHVLEVKCSLPTSDLVQLNADFSENIKELNCLLKSFDAKLLPSAAHPLMDPRSDTFLWPHDSNEIYARYNEIFNCQGHGWSNLQSCHINLPFYDDEEFAQLHAAIRLILPILPAMAASSPILDGQNTGFLDKRMDYYQKNQRKIPANVGKVIPERAYSKRQYHKLIYDHIAEAIAPFNHDDLLKPVWVNSRGAIARFDRGSVEIRILDLQECPKADLAIATFIICVLKLLVSEKTISSHDQKLYLTDDLHDILQGCIRSAEKTLIEDKNYLHAFGMDDNQATASQVWKHLYRLVQQHYPEEIKPWSAEIEFILENGTLATRILKSLGGIYTKENISMIYHELSDCLANNEMFEVWVEEKL